MLAIQFQIPQCLLLTNQNLELSSIVNSLVTFLSYQWSYWSFLPLVANSGKISQAYEMRKALNTFKLLLSTKIEDIIYENVDFLHDH